MLPGQYQPESLCPFSNTIFPPVVVCLPPVGRELCGGVVPDSGGVKLERGLDGRLYALIGCPETLPCVRGVCVVKFSKK